MRPTAVEDVRVILAEFRRTTDDLMNKLAYVRVELTRLERKLSEILETDESIATPRRPPSSQDMQAAFNTSARFTEPPPGDNEPEGSGSG